MKIGVVFPQTEIESDPAGVKSFAQSVEGLGCDHLLAYDHILGADTSRHEDWTGRYKLEDRFHEIFVLFGFLAGIAPDLELVTSILVAPQRQTALIAKQATEIDHLTGGRFRMGVGLGWNFVEFEALGENFKNRGKRIQEQVEVLRRLWTEPIVDFEGQWHTINGAGLNPLPIQRPIPLWFGGWSQPALKRAARLADGYLPQRPPEIGWKATIEQIQEWMREAGRDPSELGIEPRIEIGKGTPDDWHRDVEQWTEWGATHLSLLTLGGGLSGADAHVERIERALEVLR